jgi:hypothetical protein
VVEDAVCDHLDLPRIDADLPDEPVPAMLRQDHDGVDAVIQARLRGDLAGPRLARQDVVGGEHERPVGQQAPVEVLDGEPLQMHHVRRACGAAVGEHVGHVPGEPGQPPQRAARPAHRAAVEALVEGIPVDGRHLAVGKGARDQRDVGPRRSERRAEGVVVGRGVRGRVDDVDAHRPRDATSGPRVPDNVAARCPRSSCPSAS